MSNDKSGPAFPLGDSCWDYGNSNRIEACGMTLRDYFAAKAMQGMLASTDDKSEWPSTLVMAVSCYAWADAMLKARRG